MMKPRLIILDRDGVINHDSDEYIKSVDEFIPYEASLEAISLLNKANIFVAIASNQSGIARKFFDIKTLNRMHQKLEFALEAYQGKVDKIYFCPHGPDDNCDCRKPKAAMLEQCLKHFSIEAKETIFVGDSLRDLQAAQKCFIPAVLVKTGKGDKTIKKLLQQKSDEFSTIPVFENLLSYVKFLLTADLQV